MAFIFSLSRRHENFSQSSGFLTLLHASYIPFFNHSSNQHETSLGLKGVQYGSHVSADSQITQQQVMHPQIHIYLQDKL